MMVENTTVANNIYKFSAELTNFRFVFLCKFDVTQQLIASQSAYSPSWSLSGKLW